MGKSKKTRQAQRRASKRAALLRAREAEEAERIIDLRSPEPDAAADLFEDISSHEPTDDRQLHEAREVRDGLLSNTFRPEQRTVVPVTTSEADEISSQLWDGDDVRVVDMSDRRSVTPRSHGKRRRGWLRRLRWRS